jgi:hypothetical protein
VQRVGVDHGRPVELVEQPPHDLLRPVAAPSPARARARRLRRNSAIGSTPRRDLPVLLGARQLHRLEQALLEDGQRRVGHGDRDVARVGAEGGLGARLGRR